MRWRGNISVGDENQQAPFSNEKLQYLYLSGYGTVDPMVWRNGFVLILYLCSFSLSRLFDRQKASSFIGHEPIRPKVSPFIRRLIRAEKVEKINIRCVLWTYELK